MSTMTLAERRETLVNSLRASKSWTTGYAEAFVDDYVQAAHLAQPAPAVDVGAVNGVIRELREVGNWNTRTQFSFPKDFNTWADKLTRALTSEKAGRVDEPDQALLVSMATCLDHGFGLHDAKRQQSMLHDMRKLWDEVMGRGYYRPENRERYIAYLASPAPDKEG